MMIRKDEEVMKLARKVIDELLWNGASDEEVGKFKSIYTSAKRSVDLRFGGRSCIPALEDKIVELRLE